MGMVIWVGVFGHLFEGRLGLGCAFLYCSLIVF